MIDETSECESPEIRQKKGSKMDVVEIDPSLPKLVSCNNKFMDCAEMIHKTFRKYNSPDTMDKNLT